MRSWAIRRVLLCTVLGVLTSLGVAWGAVYRAYRATTPGPTRFILHGTVWEEMRTPGALFVSRRWITQYSHFLGKVDIHDADSWLESRISATPGLNNVVVAGWPFRCLTGYEQRAQRSATPGGAGSSRRYAGAVLLPHRLGYVEMVIGRAFLPTIPLWGGLVLDTAFYGALWSAALIGAPLGRRAIRRRRGRCPSCAYDLRRDLTAGCPECGWGRESSPVPRSPVQQ